MLSPKATKHPHFWSAFSAFEIISTSENSRAGTDDVPDGE